MKVTYHGNAYYLQGGKWRYVANDQLVPGAVTITNENRSIEMMAPELLAYRLVGIAAIAEMLDIDSTSVSAMLARGYICEPQARIGRSPAWSREVVRLWDQQRPGSGAHNRVVA